MDTEPYKKVLLVNNQINELVRIEVFLQDIGEEWALSESLVLSINLVIEEAFNNIVSYGYDDECKHTIELCFEKYTEEIKIKIIDDGHEYDPTLKAEPDITLKAEERPVGGLGIYLIKQIMDNVEYKRIENKNYLILTKRMEL
jgi:serine/threonine-protein kinase RsbW